MAQSKQKGDGYERKIAKLFANAFGLEMRRTPLSGGWAKGNPGVAGDIVCIDPGPDAFGYCIECKNVEGWRMESLYTPDHAWFDNWWQQALDECIEGKRPLLVFTRAYAPDFVAFKFSHAPMIAPESCWHNGTYTVVQWGPWYNIVIILLIDFLYDVREALRTGYKLRDWDD